MKDGKTKYKDFHILIGKGKGKGKMEIMKRKLIIDGNAVYEIDEECMLGKRIKHEGKAEAHTKTQSKKTSGYNARKDME